jgi:hypothetical protein
MASKSGGLDNSDVLMWLIILGIFFPPLWPLTVLFMGVGVIVGLLYVIAAPFVVLWWGIKWLAEPAGDADGSGPHSRAWYGLLLAWEVVTLPVVLPYIFVKSAYETFWPKKPLERSNSSTQGPTILPSSFMSSAVPSSDVVILSIVPSPSGTAE